MSDLLIKIGDRTYDTATLDELSLRMLLELEQQTVAFGHPLPHHEVARINDELMALKPDDRGKHPDAIWMTAATIWAARRMAGENVTFADAVDIPMSQLEFIPKPGSQPVNPQKARPAVSGRAGKPRPTGQSKKRT